MRRLALAAVLLGCARTELHEPGHALRFVPSTPELVGDQTAPKSSDVDEDTRATLIPLAKPRGEKPFIDRRAIRRAIDAATQHASCDVPFATRVRLRVHPTGRVTMHEVLAPQLSPTDTVCLQAAFEVARVPPFEGSALDLVWSLSR